MKPQQTPSRHDLIEEWDVLTEHVDNLYVARLDKLRELGWCAIVLPIGRPDTGAALPSGRDELQVFVEASGGSAFVVQPDYGIFEMAASGAELRQKMSMCSDDFVVAGGNGALRMIVADAEAHVVVGKAAALREFCEGELPAVEENLKRWMDEHKKFSVDHRVLQRLMSYYGPVLLTKLTS